MPGFLTKYEVYMSSGDIKVLIFLPVVMETTSTHQQKSEILSSMQSITVQTFQFLHQRLRALDWFILRADRDVGLT